MPNGQKRTENGQLSTAHKQRFTHIPELDGLRGIAALAVLGHHLFYTSVPRPERWNWFVVAASRLGHAGGFGVDIFFVLSGFLITSLLLLDRKSPNYYWNFYWKRALRILPLYLIVLIALAALSPASWRYALLSLLFAANFAQLFHVAENGPFWTLAIEEQFYLAWPRVVRQIVQRFTLRSLERFAFALAAACIVLRLLDAAIGHSNFQFTFFHCDGLALGAVLACRRMRLADTSGRPALLPFAVAAMVSLALICVPLLAGAGSSGPNHRLPHVAAALLLTGVTGISTCLIAFTLEFSGSRYLALLRSRTLTFFGLISYCLYLVNSYVVQGYDRLRGPMPVGDMTAFTARAVIVFAITAVLCIVSRYAIELPAARLRRHLLR